MTTSAPSPLRWDGARLHVLDQTLLPAREEVLILEGADDTAEAIVRLAVRGAPLIGVAAAYGLAMAVARDPADLDRAARVLATARPTARNLAWAVERVRAARGGRRAGRRARARPWRSTARTRPRAPRSPATAPTCCRSWRRADA